MHHVRISVRRVAVLALCVASTIALTTLTGHANGASRGHAQASFSPKFHRTHWLTGSTGKAVFTFGVEGGNLRPWTVIVADNGAVTPSGSIKTRTQQLSDPRSTLNGLLKLADAEQFFALRTRVACRGVNPDVVSRWIMVQANGDTKRVSVHGTCVSAFNQLYGVLMAATGASL